MFPDTQSEVLTADRRELEQLLDIELKKVLESQKRGAGTETASKSNSIEVVEQMKRTLTKLRTLDNQADSAVNKRIHVSQYAYRHGYNQHILISRNSSVVNVTG